MIWSKILLVFSCLYMTSWMCGSNTGTTTFVVGQSFNCTMGSVDDGTNVEHCVNRPSYYIKVIVHGTQSDPLWQQLQSSMYQTAHDLQIDLEMNLYDSYDPGRMANDIRTIYEMDDPNFIPDALIVTVPDAVIQTTIGQVLGTSRNRNQIPIFGVNVGSDVATTLGFVGQVSMDEYLAGTTAGDYIRILTGRILDRNKKGIYINHDFGDLGLEERLLGLQDSLPDFEFEKLNFFAGDEIERSVITEAFRGCPYTVVQLAGPQLLEDTFRALERNRCDLANTVIGAYDTNAYIYQSIYERELDFTVSQQVHFQGALPVVMAALYVTTGKKLAPSELSFFGNYQSGPALITHQNVPSMQLQACEREGFPVCGSQIGIMMKKQNNSSNNNAAATNPWIGGINNNNMSSTEFFMTTITTDDDDPLSGLVCECAERSKIRLVGISHGDTGSNFWNNVYAGMVQAVTDFGVTADLVRFDPQDDDSILIQMQADAIVKSCEEGADGVFTSIPNDAVADALKRCQELDVPVISLNAGSKYTDDLGIIQYVGQIESVAGKKAGKTLLAQGVQHGLCLVKEESNDALYDRCKGMEVAFAEANIDFVGTIHTPAGADNFIDLVEDAIGQAGNWEGYAILGTSQSILPDILRVKAIHPKVIIGSFDFSPDLYTAFENKDVLFGTDQGPYLQGYLPVALLTWNAYTNQKPVDTLAESGPSFLFSPPTKEEQQCQAVQFKACDNEVPTRNRTVSETSTGYSIISTSSHITGIVTAMALSAFFLFVQ